MPEVITAKTAGFCFGVDRAVNTVYEELKDHDAPVYTFGPIVHNEAVTEDLRQKGVHVLETPDELNGIPKGTVIIRAHGVPRSTDELLRARGFNVVDATCPFVKKIHRIVERENSEGRRVIVVGDPSHPEVMGIKGWGREDTLVIQSMEEFTQLALPQSQKYSLVVQTTFNFEKISEIIARLKKLDYDIRCFNTVCNATQERQKEAGKIASGVDAMIVIGSKNSSNTRKLYDICSKRCNATVLIQDLDDLTCKDFDSVNSVGITAGASTPKHIIEEVQTNVRFKF